jgi:hypothetical protein
VMLLGHVELRASEIPPLRRCYRCRELLPADAFAIDRSKASGRKSICKACDRANAQTSYAARRRLNVIGGVQGRERGDGHSRASPRENSDVGGFDQFGGGVVYG